MKGCEDSTKNSITSYLPIKNDISLSCTLLLAIITSHLYHKFVYLIY